MTTIARNLMIDRARAERRHARFGSAEPDVDGLAGPTVDAEWLVAQNELGKIIQETISGWEDSDRRFFALRYLDELPQRVVAASLGISPITARRLDAKLRTRLL